MKAGDILDAALALMFETRQSAADYVEFAPKVLNMLLPELLGINNQLCGLAGKAVSYTHLDVYKRQPGGLHLHRGEGIRQSGADRTGPRLRRNAGEPAKGFADVIFSTKFFK